MPATSIPTRPRITVDFSATERAQTAATTRPIPIARARNFSGIRLRRVRKSIAPPKNILAFSAVDIAPMEATPSVLNIKNTPA